MVSKRRRSENKIRNILSGMAIIGAFDSFLHYTATVTVQYVHEFHRILSSEGGRCVDF